MQSVQFYFIYIALLTILLQISFKETTKFRIKIIYLKCIINEQGRGDGSKEKFPETI